MPIAEQALVLVGGLGTRLRAVVPDLPKPMAPVGGRPFLAIILERLAVSGMRRVVLATGYKGEVISDAFGASWEGMELIYSREDEPMGTGGAVALATRQLQPGGVHVCNGDTYLEYDLSQLQRSTTALGVHAAVALAEVENVGRYGAVTVREGKAVDFLEKGGHGPGLINAGSYFLDDKAISSLPAQTRFSLESDFLVPLARQGGLAAMDASRGFIDIGVPEDYARAQMIWPAGI